MSAQNSRRSGFALAAGLLLVLILGVTAVSAAGLVQQDKRLNQIADFGGDALYCMDATNSPTIDSATFDHFQLLSKSGQSLWSLPRSTVEEGLGQIKQTPNIAQQLGNGLGSFGEINLYANAAQDQSPYFIFTGFDEYGKANRIIFYGCTPVGSALAS